MFQYQPISTWKKTVAAFLVAALINLMQGCYYYKVTTPQLPPKDALPSLQAQNKFFIVHDIDNAWSITNIQIDTTNIIADIEILAGHDYYKTTDSTVTNRFKKNKIINESEVLEEVHIYLHDYKVTPGKSITIPIRFIQRIEVYDYASGATVASWVFSGIGITLSLAGIVTLIILLTKSSCPFVYSYNGDEYAFEGEIFSGATQPSLERDDYLRLAKINALEPDLKLKISNKVKEVQHIDFAELQIVDHDQNDEVLMDKNGKIYAFSNPVIPTLAVNKKGNDILPLLNAKDTLYYAGDEKHLPEEGLENVYLKFPKKAGSDTASLILRAKNDFWLDILFTWFHSLLGERYAEFSAKQERSSGEQLEKWLTDQHIPLSVYLKKNGTWELIDYFNLPGPMALRDDILSFSIKEIKDDTIDIKLDFGFMFWNLDYLAMDFHSSERLHITKVPLTTATGQDGTDLLSLLSAADHRYYDQPLVGDEAILTFDKIKSLEHSQTLFLHTRGYYKILRDQTGKPQLKLLKTFRQPGRFPEYSVEQYKKFSGK